MTFDLCIVGLGYIGLPTAGVFADRGISVIGVDVNESVVNKLSHGEVHIYEPDLDRLIKKVWQERKIDFCCNPVRADVYILAVPTPFMDGHKADLKHVKAAAESIAPYLDNGALVILESTSPVGTTEKVAEWISAKREDLYYVNAAGEKSNVAAVKEIFFAHCPERVLPGRILYEIVHNDRIIGGINRQSAEKAKELYENIVEGEIVLTDSRTAEMSKLTENAFRDVNIAFANELSLICDSLDINVWELISLANRHPRVNILNPGPGVGGHCIAVDPWFIVDSVPERANLIRQAREINDYKPQYVLEKIEKSVKNYNNPVVAVLGVTFKADVDDLRESPALKIAEMLAKKGYSLLVVEPYITELPKGLKNKPNVSLCILEKALHDANVILALVDHKLFYEIDKNMFNGKTVIDTRGIWQKD